MMTSLLKETSFSLPFMPLLAVLIIFGHISSGRSSVGLRERAERRMFRRVQPGEESLPRMLITPHGPSVVLELDLYRVKVSSCPSLHIHPLSSCNSHIPEALNNTATEPWLLHSTALFQVSSDPFFSFRT